jgi:hypothetical protein
MRFWLRTHLIVLATVLSAVLGFALSITDARSQDVALEFRQSLDSYGRWIDHPRWGALWIPADVASDWRPYWFGSWVYTDEWGWYWVSDEEWGWITYHYGRWLWDSDLGWCWMPGNDWAPAWVSWRRGDDIVGWAPMPPDDYVVDNDLEPLFWSFVYPADIVAPSLPTVVLPVAQASVFIQQTVFVNLTVMVRTNNGIVVANPGVPPAIIAAHMGHPLRTVAVEPHVVPGTARVANAIVGPPSKGAGVRDTVKPQMTLIQPVGHIPPPTAYQSGQAILGPNVPEVLHGANVTSATTPAATNLPDPEGVSNAPNPPGITVAPAIPSGPSVRAPNERPSTPPQMMRPNLGIEPPPPPSVRAPIRPTPPTPPPPPAPNPPRSPVVTSAPHPLPPRPPEPSRQCALVNGRQICR